VAYIGHVTGGHAPGLKDMRTGFLVAHHLLLSHGMALQAFRQLGLKGEIGITLNIQLVHPASEREDDLAAARRLDGVFNRWYLDPLFRGEYPADIWELLAGVGVAPAVQEGDLQLIGQPIDFLGINYYSRTLAAHDPGARETLGVRMLSGPGPKTDMGWEIYPPGIYQVLTGIHQKYKPKKLYITENGAAFPDRLEEQRGGEDGETYAVHDRERVDYLGRHFYQAGRAIEAGVPLAGYFVWSLLDNFEWAFGYTKRFGIIYVDYPTQRRVWKDSARFYQEVVAENAVDDRFAE